MILSDRSIREELAAGRIVIDPLDERCIQPSSVDLHVDRYFRVFRNHTMRVIDVKEDQEELTELVEIKEDDPFILHPGEFVLGSTIERVRLPNDLVARLEGKSSLGRLGLLIHSSLPAGERVLVLADGTLAERPIDDIVGKRLEGCVVGFDPDTFAVDYFPITGWYEGPPDRVFEVRLASGRLVRVTAGHNFFTIDRRGDLRKVRTTELGAGAHVAIAGDIPSPDLPAPAIEALRLVPEALDAELVLEGPAARAAFDDPTIRRLLRDAGFSHTDFYRARGCIPLSVGRQLPSVLANVSEHDRIRVRGGRNSIPAVLRVDTDLAWLLGLYVAEGYRRRGQVVISNTQSEILDRAQYAFGRLGLKVSRREGVAITCSSVAFSALIAALGIGDGAAHKRLPVGALGWPRTLLSALFDGLLAGDGRREATRDTYWTCSTALAGEILLLAERLGRRAAVSWRPRGRSGLFEIGMPKDEHTLLTGVPLPDELLVELRRATGVTQAQLAAVAGYRRASDLNNIERRSARDAVRLETLRRLRGALAPAGSSDHQPKLDRLVDGHLRWDRVEEVRDTGEWAPIFDLEVRPDGRHVENFLAGWGGVFVSNTAGFVDAGWDGQLTLELSNVANLPITLYPGMKIGQISFLRMTTAAEHPYGSGEVGSKYQGQVGPRPSRYYENFRDTR